MFENLMNRINYEVTRRLFKVEIQVAPVEEKKDQAVLQAASRIDPFTQKKPPDEKQPAPVVSPTSSPTKKPGRNDPCWCGSGKKYKKCHYPN
jgi:preprotein translocase subunit SecA